MAWNDLAKRVLVNAIGTVESNNRFDAIYYSDPITVGFMQWFGPRAVGILKRMMTENPSSMSGMAGTLRSWLDRGGPSASTRYLSRAEGSSIQAGLRANAPIQVDQALKDFESYAATASSLGLSRESNTQAYIMWCVAFHQSPARARRLLRAVGPTSSLDRIHSALLNEPVFGKYKNRYNTSYRIIKTMNPGSIHLSNQAGGNGSSNDGPVVDDGDGQGGQDLDGDGVPDVLERQDGQIGYIEAHGDSLLVRMRDGKNVWAHLNNAGIYVVGGLPAAGATVPGGPGATGVTPDAGGGGGGGAGGGAGGGGDGSIGARVVAWLAARKGRFYYTNGADRWNPDKTGGGDCSSVIRRAYLDIAGIDIGNRSFDIARRGKEVQSGRGPRGWNKSLWRAGDVVCMGLTYARAYSSSGISHVECYTGDGQHSWGHGGGPGGRTKGPTYNDLFGRGYLGSATVWTVRRFS